MGLPLARFMSYAPAKPLPPGMVQDPLLHDGNHHPDVVKGLAVINTQPSERHEFAEVDVGDIPCEATAASWAAWLLPPVGIITCCTGLYTVETREAAVIQHCGVLTSVQEEPGVYWTTPCGRNLRSITTKTKTMEIASAKVADGNGNPVVVSCIINYRVVDPTKAVLKQTVSHYSYDQLKADYDHVNDQMRGQLQPLLFVAGVQVESVCLNDLAYAPEVAAAMLKKQQAQALIDARTLIVQGACRIAQDAVRLLEDDGDSQLQLDDEAKVKIVTNLLTVTCSESDATPTLGLGN